MATKGVAFAGGRERANGNDNGCCEGSPKSLAIASAGITTGTQFARLMSALMTDLLEGEITPGVANATVNAGGKLLKVVEMQLKYGTSSIANSRRNIELVGAD